MQPEAPAGEKKTTCAECGKSFSTHSALIIHRRRPLPCPECGKGSVQRSGTHLEDKPHKRPACGKGFSARLALVAHQRAHAGESAEPGTPWGPHRPYQCPQCEKSFIRSSHLVAHRRLHAGERPSGAHAA
ncbi:unnamed protein product [Caretta caretta]